MIARPCKHISLKFVEMKFHSALQQVQDRSMVPMRPASTPVEAAGYPMSIQQADNVTAEQVCSCAPDGVVACAKMNTCQMICRQ